MPGQTIVAGSTVSAGYTIGAGAGSGFTLVNQGVAGGSTASFGVLVDPAGDLVFNSGKIIANPTTGTGVSLAQGGYLQNASGATLTGQKGLIASSAAATLVNTGSVTAAGAFFGVRLNHGGSVTNNNGGTISGGYGGVYISGASGTAFNSGKVTGGTAGIFLRGGGAITNFVQGSINAAYAIAIGGGAGTVTNVGLVNGTNLGVEESKGGSVSNNGSGTIKGALGVHILGGAGTVVNAGTIDAGASGKGVTLASGYNNMLAIYPGSTIIGTVDLGNAIGGAASSQLRLGSGGVVSGTLTGIGTKYLNFAQLDVVAFALWTIGASIPTGMTLTDNGTLTNLGIVHTTATLGSGARLTNSTGAGITGSTDGVVATVGTATVVNNGQIAGTTVVSYGVWLGAGGTLTNQSQGTISGREAVYFGGSSAAAVVNAGKILAAAGGNGVGLRLNGGGTVANLGGTISGVDGIQVISGAAAITNSGTIIGGVGGEAVKFASNVANQLTMVPGAVFTGGVDGGNAIGSATVSTLELASGASTGTINGIGSSYVGFGNVVVDSGATWVMDAGVIASAATLTVYGALTNNGFVYTTTTLGSGSSLTNTKNALLSGGFAAAVYGAGFVAVLNDGQSGAIELAKGGSVTNQADGTISGQAGVTIFGGGGVVANAGRIIAGNGTAVSLPGGGFGNEVDFTPGAVFGGVVDGGNPLGSSKVSTLMLRSGASTGTLSGIGSQYKNFGNFVVASGATWVLAGSQTIAANATLTDNGSLTNSATVLSAVTLGSGASLTNASSGLISSSGFPGVLDSAGPGTVVNSGTITGSYAVSLGAGGTVTNQAGYLGGLYGVYIRNGAGSVTNLGKIVASQIGKKAVSLAAGYANRVVVGAGARFVGAVDGGNNSASKAVSTLELTAGTSAGVIGTLNGLGSQYLNFASFAVDAGASWVLGGNQTIAAGDTVSDGGTLTNNAVVLTGVRLGPNASLTNGKGATISGTQYAASGGIGLHTVVNDGLLYGYDGVQLFGSGSVTNQSDGTIVGQTSVGAGGIAVAIDGASGGTVSNSGQIKGGTAGGGVSVQGGSVTNLGGTISGGTGVKVFGAAGTVANYATIVGNAGTAVSLPAGFANRMVIGAGAVFNGVVDGGNDGASSAVSTLELTTGTSAGVIGTLGGIGSQYLNFGNFLVDADASWVLSGGQTIGSGDTLTDNGTLTNNASVATSVILGSGASLTNASGGTISESAFFGNGVTASGPATLANYGGIQGGGVGFGVFMNSGGVVINHAGTISAASGIDIVGGRGTVTNYAEILATASRTGVQLSAGGIITNRSGTLSGGVATRIFAGGTVVNFATIQGLNSSADAVYFKPSYQNLLEIAPGSTIIGVANGGNTIGAASVSTLELITGTSAGVVGTVGAIGTLGQAGAQYVNFADVVVDAGASWTLPAAQTLAANETLTDNGTLTNNGILLAPVTLGAGASLTNAHGAQISDYATAFTYAIRDSGAGVVVNDGLIAGGARDGGVAFYHGGTVTNQAFGTITAAGYAAVGVFSGLGTVTNNGVIQGNNDGVLLNAGGTVVNQAGTIGATSFAGVGIYGGPGTVANYATIVAGTSGAAVYLSAGYTDRLVIGVGAVFAGTVNGGNKLGASAVSTLELTTGTSVGVVGTIGGIGSQYVHFADIVVDAGASWVLAATQTIASGYTLTDNGRLTNNKGSILGGITIGAGATLTNVNGATLYGSSFGVTGVVGPGTIVNDGRIAESQTNSFGVDLAFGGAVTNQGYGTISGNFAVAGVGGTVSNAGTLKAVTAGVSFAGGGSVTNVAGGRITGANGVAIHGGAGTVVNGGSIRATAVTGYSVYLPAGFSNRLVEQPGAVFFGQVNGGNSLGAGATSTLELATTAPGGPAQGTLTGLGSQFVNFAAVAVDPGASWSLAGQNAIAAGSTLSDAGTLAINGDLLVDGSLVDSSSVLSVGQAGAGRLVIENQGIVVSNQPASLNTGLDIGRSAGDAGDVLVTGPQAKLLSAGQFVVGDGGSGSLAIRSGGSVQTTSGLIPGLDGAVIAAQAGSDGSGVTVTGAGSNWDVIGLLAVGNAAAGSLAITAGGTVQATTMDAGVLAGGSGIVSVIGAGSAVILSGSLIVGDDASAELSILTGGMVSAMNADIGVQAGGTGNVDIEGAGSHLDIANDLNIGGAGVGVLTLGNNTELTVGNNLVVGANGVLNQFGGAIDPSTITIVAGGRQGGHGTSTASVLISNAGTLFASSGTETVISPLITAPSGKSGVLEIDAAGDLVLNVASVDATQSVTFTDGTGILTIGTIGGFAATIVGVNAGDQIIVQGKSIASDSFNASAHTLTLFDGASATIGTLQLGPSVDGTAILANGTGGLGVAPCFMAGTRISTERGEVAVEDLRVGDRVQVVPLHPHPNPRPRSGGGLGRGSAQPITWIGHRTVDCQRHPKPHQVHPVRIAAHALGPNRPARDLYLSPDHALYINGVLIPVKHLINGSTIAQVPRASVTYFHLELPRHAVLLAENLPAESYLDTGDRANFANGPGPVALHPDFAARRREAEGCAPLVVTGEELDSVRHWINLTATLSPARTVPLVASSG